MSKIKRVFTFLSDWNTYLDLIIFSFSRKNHYTYVPAEKMCHLPTLCGFAAGILMFNLDFNGAAGEYVTSMIWTLAFAVAGVNAFFHFRRVFAMPNEKWATVYLIYIYAVSIAAFMIWVLLIYCLILGIVIIILLIVFGNAMKPEPKKFYGNKAFHYGEELHEELPGQWVSTRTRIVYVKLDEGGFIERDKIKN